MPTTPSLRCARIAVILSLVSITLLLLRNNCIPLHQFSNFVLSLLNHSRSRTILLGVTAYTLLFIVAGAISIDISLSIYLFVLLEVLFMICKDPSLLDSAFILSICLELVLVLLMVYTTCILFFIW